MTTSETTLISILNDMAFSPYQQWAKISRIICKRYPQLPLICSTMTNIPKKQCTSDDKGTQCLPMKGVATAVLIEHYSPIVLKQRCVFVCPRSVVIDVPSEPSGLWGPQIWPLQRWVDQQLRYDWLRNALDASSDLLLHGIHMGHFVCGGELCGCVCVHSHIHGLMYMLAHTYTSKKHPVDIPYLPRRVMDW